MSVKTAGTRTAGATLQAIVPPRLWRDRSLLIGAIVVVVVFVAGPLGMNSYWLQASTVAIVYALIAGGAGLLVGRVGLYSLCQIALTAAGSWMALRLGFGTSLPFPVIILLSGAFSAVLGIIIGLPSLWVSGLALALLTLMGASAITLVLTVIHFPNGGDGILGYSETGQGAPALARPLIGETTDGYFRYVLVVAAIVFLIVWLHLKSRPGRSWAAIRQSPASAQAAGVNITLYRVWAFLLASFIAGVAGGLLAATGGIYITQFPVQDSIILLAAVLMAGAYSLWGAVLAALLMKFIGAAFSIWNVPPGLLLMLFGAGILQSLLQSPTGIFGQLSTDLPKLWRRIRRGHRPAEEGRA